MAVHCRYVARTSAIRGGAAPLARVVLSSRRRRRVELGATDRPGRRWTVNRVLVTGRLTRDPEMRGLASGKNVTTFTVASNEFLGGGKEKAEYHAVVAWV